METHVCYISISLYMYKHGEYMYVYKYIYIYVPQTACLQRSYSFSRLVGEHPNPKSVAGPRGPSSWTQLVDRSRGYKLDNQMLRYAQVSSPLAFTPYQAKRGMLGVKRRGS